MKKDEQKIESIIFEEAKISEQNSPSVQINVNNEFEWGKGTFDERDKIGTVKRTSSIHSIHGIDLSS